MLRIFPRSGPIPEASFEKKVYTNTDIIRTIMQLPRGTFREIKRNEKTGDILEELERSRFSGICSMSYGNSVTTLVMKGGKLILATAGNRKGDDVLEELQTISGQNVDAALSILDDAQIQLSLEFNKAERITRTGRRPPMPQKPAHKPAPATHLGQEKNHVVSQKQPSHDRTAEPAPVSSPGQLKTPVQFAQLAVQTPEYPELPVREAKKPAPEENTAPAQGSEQTSFEKDIDTFDTMDMDHMTEKIRDDCKTMVKQLRLEHLMEKD